MRLVICCNHSYPHIGGSETVIQQVAESLTRKYQYHCIVLSSVIPVDKTVWHNGVEMHHCPRDFDSFCHVLEKLEPDHIFVYSDCFMHWPSMINKPRKIPAKMSIALVGMNHMSKNSNTRSDFKKHEDRINVITHSDKYRDYTACKLLGITPTVINNGVNLDEFINASQGFRRKYKIKPGKKMILIVSNFFPGKGQEEFVDVLELLYEMNPDFEAVFISSSVNFRFAQVLSNRCKTKLTKSKFLYSFLENLPREDIVSAFCEADLFAFPSQKEVAPLVVLESMAASTPWVSLKVGNVEELCGGIIVSEGLCDGNDYIAYDKTVQVAFASSIGLLLSNEDELKQLGEIGSAKIEVEYDWDRITPQYNHVFSGSFNGTCT
jgi:glycosyltransferase involved in cell wall biosynthesis